MFLRTLLFWSYLFWKIHEQVNFTRNFKVTNINHKPLNWFLPINEHSKEAFVLTAIGDQIVPNLSSLNLQLSKRRISNQIHDQ